MGHPSLSQILGTGQRVGLGGKKYTMAPLTLSDHSTLMDWVQYHPLDEARKEIDRSQGLYNEEQRLEIIKAARGKVEDMRDIREGELADDEVKERVARYINRTLTSLDGLRMVLWLCLRHNHPDITLDEAGSLVTHDNQEAIQERIDEISFGELPGRVTDEDIKKNSLPIRVIQYGLKWLIRIFDHLCRALQRDSVTPRSKSAT